MAWWDRVGEAASTTAGLLGKGFQNALPDIGKNAAKLGLSVARQNALTSAPMMALRQGFTWVDDATDRRLSNSAPAQPQSFGGPDRPAAAAATAVNRDPTFDEFVAMLGGGGGGGVDLSGYNSMLDDITAREGALGERKAENEAYIEGIIGASRARTEDRQSGLADIVNTQLDNDSTRRATEIDLIRGADDARLNTANEARAALGSTIGADLSSAVAQNQVGGVGATGSVADSNARMLENISSQQYSRQLSGLDPMQLMANRQLSNTYEDRLGALGSERSAIQGQIAQARASARGTSMSDRMNAFGLYQSLYGPGEVPDAPGGLGVLQDFTNSAGQNTDLYRNIYDNFTTLSFGVESVDQMGNKRNPFDVAREIINNNPELDGAAMDFIAQLVQSNVG